MLNDWCQTPIHMEDFGNAMTEQHEKGVTHFEEGVSHTAAGALHSKDGLTQSPQRVPAFTEIITHSEERGSHADEQHLRTTHALHEEVPVSAITQSEEEGAQSGDWIPLNTERVTHCEEGGHMLMSEYYLLRLWTLFLIGGNEIDIKLLRRVSYRFQKPHVARELAKLDILDVAPIHLPLLGTNSSDVCIEEIKEANGLIGDTIYAGKLTGNKIPKWVDRLARIGSLCNCVLCEVFKTSVVRYGSNFEGYDNKKERLRSFFSCLSSISMH
ncbi:uncharacterized protein LOC114301983 isoform X1 [Camellia sinensis]|uniref:uncharacterized protein LOC114301983 isoform X1 n=1 Tax=Camellia sinensis TaxID=4442 RepID=UPI001035D14A|nr:uncharacterized protein LOC114301983 isoform X1 [Camellia sinensis]XP_028102748.1 uncharacterized protein LOC114301983 isoform X1 [Camellia sinensis]XP_028102749.1 uncharacterized protein LOC114301983 isoform X1 [Camellia sinensis]XP_028102750.1 uncharacterized protein LOC114301983 isoform X1 [Camellia sinensis]